MCFWHPFLSPCFRLWKRDPASPKSSTWKRTVSANTFCAASLSRGEVPSRFQSVWKTQLFWAHSVGLSASVALTGTTKDCCDEQGYNAQCAYKYHHQTENSPIAIPVRGNQYLLHVGSGGLFEQWNCISHKEPVWNFIDSNHLTSALIACGQEHIVKRTYISTEVQG